MRVFQNILVYLDGAANNDALVERAAQLAEHQQATLKLVDTVPTFHWPAKLVLPDYQHVERLLAAEKDKQLQSMAATLSPREILVSTKVLVGQASVEIIREVARHHHDLVLCRAKGLHSKRGGPLGTTSLKLLRNCPSAVWVFPQGGRVPIRRALVAIDPIAYDDAHAELNDTLMELGKSLRDSEGCELLVAHVWSLFGEQVLRSRLTPPQIDALRAAERSDAEQSLRQIIARHELPCESDQMILVEGDPPAVIPEIVERKGIDLLMMGTVGRGGVAGFMMGNTAETVFNRVACSILAVKPTSFVSSIRLDEKHHGE